MVTAPNTQTPAMDAWARLLRGHAALVRSLNQRLAADHGLTINDYEALLLLSHAEEKRLRRTDLAQSIQLTPSGVTRLLEGLERAGFVAKVECAEDARAIWAVLTDAGRAKLDEASCSHVRAIEDLFGERYSPDEIETLGDLLSRLPGAARAESCSPPPA